MPVAIASSLKNAASSDSEAASMDSEPGPPPSRSRSANRPTASAWIRFGDHVRSLAASAAKREPSAHSRSPGPPGDAEESSVGTAIQPPSDRSSTGRPDAARLISGRSWSRSAPACRNAIAPSRARPLSSRSNRSVSARRRSLSAADPARSRASSSGRFTTVNRAFGNTSRTTSIASPSAEAIASA